MIERYDDVQQRNQWFAHNLVAEAGKEIFRREAQKNLKGYEFHSDSVHDLFVEYFEAPKQLGSYDDELLRVIALRGLAYLETDQIPSDLKADILELAGSALWEAAFVQAVTTHNSIGGVDERLEYIHGYDKLTKRARELVSQDSVEHHRLSVKLCFTQVLKDIVCGEITSDTVEEIEASLVTLLDDVRDAKDRRKVEGLVGEIKVLQYYWANYHKKGDLVAVPSTVRGDSGVYLPAETHDIDILRQRKDESWIVRTPIEVKKRQIQQSHLQRYARSLLAYVAPDGNVSISGSHRAFLVTNEEEQPAL